MAKKTPAHKPNEIRIKEEDRRDDDFFDKQTDPYVLPPELNMTIKDGFRFGIGFVLAMLVFYVVVLVGIIIFLQLGKFLPG